MDELFLLLLELVLECLVEGGLSAFASESSVGTVDSGRLVRILAALAGGALIGALSLMVAPGMLLHGTPLRVANLVLAPVTAAAAAYALPRRVDAPAGQSRRFGAACAACFAFALVATRWGFGA